MDQWSLKELPQDATCDVLVVGGGPAGLAAAISASEAGRSVRLIERGGFLGGRATQSMVLILDDWTDGREQTVFGVAERFVKRLEQYGGAAAPPAAAWRAGASLTPEEIETWSSWGFVYLYGQEKPRPITLAVSFDPETFKYVAEEMLLEQNVSYHLFTDLVGLVGDGERPREAIVRERGGYRRVPFRALIDASGDGDAMAYAGAPYHEGQYFTTLVHRFGGVDVAASQAFSLAEPQRSEELNREVRRLYGGSWDRWWLRTTLPGVVWVNAPHLTDYNALSSRDLTEATREARVRIFKVLEHVRRHLPGFQEAYLIDTCAEIGTRESRLLAGAYTMQQDDILGGRPFDDSIGMGRNYHMPYRSLYSEQVPNLWVAGRCFSVDPIAQRSAREIAPCMVMGEAAGLAAAQSVARGVPASKVDVDDLQRTLQGRGVIL